MFASVRWMSHSLEEKKHLKKKTRGNGGGAGHPVRRRPVRPPVRLRVRRRPVRLRVRPRSGSGSGPGPAVAASTHLMNEMYTIWGLPWLSQARS